MMIGRPSNRWNSDGICDFAMPCSCSLTRAAAAMRNSVSSTTDMSFGLISATTRAAIEDDQPVGDFVHMGEIVLDIDAGAAGLLDAPDEIEDLADLGDRQRRRRLVEDDEVGVVVHGAADGDALPLAAGQVGDGGIDA